MGYQLYDYAARSILPADFPDMESAADMANTLHTMAIREYGRTEPLELYQDGKPAPPEDRRRFNDLLMHAR